MVLRRAFCPSAWTKSPPHPFIPFFLRTPFLFRNGLRSLKPASDHHSTKTQSSPNLVSQIKFGHLTYTNSPLSCLLATLVSCRKERKERIISFFPDRTCSSSPGWVQLNNSCYLMSTKSMNWFQAEQVLKHDRGRKTGTSSDQLRFSLAMFAILHLFYLSLYP